MAPCPDVPALERFLLGRIAGPEAEQLDEHIGECRHCADRLRTVRAEDLLVQTMRVAREVTPPPAAERLQTLVAMMRCLRPRGETQTLGPHDAATPSGVTFSFLGPPQRADALGTMGPYQVLEVLGAGGMGLVFRAFDPRLQRELAIKVIRPDLDGRTRAVDRFLQEARAAAAVEHENIVTIYQADEVGGVPYLAMPLLRGQSLEERLQTAGGPLPVDEVLRMGREAALGLAAAHERGLVHRDVKPANLWLEAGTGRVKVLDFGLAFAGGAEEAGLIVGTPAYMAPEQARSLPLDGRADLFSLGCVLYRAATGQIAFEGKDTIDLLLRIATEPVTPPRQVNPRLPADVAALIERLLAKEPAERPASARQLADEIAALERRRQGAARPWWRRAVGLGAAVVLGLALAAALWAGFGRRPPDEPSVPIEQERAPIGELLQHRGHTGSVSTVALVEAPEGRIVLSAGHDRRVCLWDAQSETAQFLTPPLRDEERLVPFPPLLCLAVSVDGKTAAFAGGDRRGGEPLVFRWGLASRKPLGPPLAPAHPGLITALAFEPDGKHLLSGSTDGLLLRTELASGRTTQRFPPPDPERGRLGVHGLAVSPDGKRALRAGGDGSLILLDLPALTVRRTIDEAHRDGVNAVAFLPDGKGFASAGKDGIVRVWDGEAFTAIDLKGHDGSVLSLSVRGDRLLSGGADGTLRLWGLSTGKRLQTLSGHQGAVNSVALSADGLQAFSGGLDRTVRLWQLPQ